MLPRLPLKGNYNIFRDWRLQFRVINLPAIANAIPEAESIACQKAVSGEFFATASRPKIGDIRKVIAKTI